MKAEVTGHAPSDNGLECVVLSHSFSCSRHMKEQPTAIAKAISANNNDYRFH
ncbi:MULTISPECIES: hypothetical protein [Stutzerimonas]|uniref:hypothetical protein n=1 Tax=Stutzerimonas TaxID=2901164 RepID=UPI0028966764|nr:hypothetical protein [Stutzerimonas nitrititolerans]